METRVHTLRGSRRRIVRSLAAVAVAIVPAACGSDSATGIEIGSELAVSFENLPQIDALDGSYEAWVTDAAGTAYSLGRFQPAPDLTFGSPVSDARAFLVTVEAPGDADATPSAAVLLAGQFHGGRADLRVEGAVTAAGLALRLHPGQFTMFTPSDNIANRYPSNEEAGIWLFNMYSSETEQKDFWVRLTQLASGWTYEGWMVRDYGSPNAIWLSYGKFVTDASGTVNRRDDDGWGPFSGAEDYRADNPEDFPGSDWVANVLGLPFPAELSLPLDLRERTSTGEDRWTHVLTIEPGFDVGQPTWESRPFVVRPYRDPFGQGGPGQPRTITFRPEGVPGGTVLVR